MGCQKQINYLTESKPTLKVVWNRSNFEHPFGMLMPGRNWEAAGVEYRIGFQGQENDRNIKGKGNSVNFNYRMHDPRLGRFFAVDPLSPNYPHYTPYSFSGNKVIAFVELEGLEEGGHGKNNKIYKCFKFKKSKDPKLKNNRNKGKVSVGEYEYETIRMSSWGFRRNKIFTKKSKKTYVAGTIVVNMGANNGTGRDNLDISWEKTLRNGEKVTKYKTSFALFTKREERTIRQNGGDNTQTIKFNDGNNSRVVATVDGGISGPPGPRAFGGSITIVTVKQTRKNIWGKPKLYGRKRGKRIQQRIDNKYARRTS